MTTDDADQGFPSEVFLRHAARRAWKVAYLVLGDGFLAEDVAQETLLKVDRHRSRLRPATAGAWVSRVAYNKAVDIRRRRDREVLDDGQHGIADVPVSGNLDENVLIRLMLEPALRALPASLHEVVILRFRDDLTTREIAARTGRSEGTIRNDLSKALKLLREFLMLEGAEP